LLLNLQPKDEVFGFKKQNNQFNYFLLIFRTVSLYLSGIILTFLISFPHFQQVRGTPLARRKRAPVAKFWAWQWGQGKTLLIVRYPLFVISYSFRFVGYGLFVPSSNNE